MARWPCPSEETIGKFNPVNAENKIQSTPPGWRRTPLIPVLGGQAIGAAVAFGGAKLLADTVSIQFFWVLLLQGCIAAALGHVWRLPRWWIAVNIILPPAAGFASGLPVPPELYLAIFVVLLLVFWNAGRTRVPLYLTNPITWRAITAMLDEHQAGKFIDIGCGIGGAVFYVARARPNWTVVGIESAPLPFALSWIRWKLSGLSNAQIIYGDFWKHDVSNYDVAYAFLSPAPMLALYEKAVSEMSDESRLISNSFVVPGHPAQAVTDVNDRRQTELHVWRMGKIEK